MNIPSYSTTQNTEYYNDELSQALVDGLSDNGWTLPQQTTSEISDVSSQMPDGTMWYDSTTNEFKVKIDGAVKTVTTS